MASRATESGFLEQRIAENTAAQEIDLGKWIFDRLHVPPESRILELCCGTGGQTLKFLPLLGDTGQIVGLDVSRDALNTLASKAEQVPEKLILIQGNLDEFGSCLQRAGIQPSSFDLVFCAYGLYYSAAAQRRLEEAHSWLKPGGRIVVVGPFGPNNKPLFDLVRESGAVISKPVIDSSEHFMLQTVLPWAALNFEEVRVHTMVNRVRWLAPERVLNYWENTTFYDAARRAAFENLLRRHFEKYGVFGNEKWVMMAEMIHARG